MITIVYNLLIAVLELLFWAILLSGVVSLLLTFNILDRHNRFVWGTADFLNRVTDPILRPIQRRLPLYNSIDFSPLVALLAIRLIVEPMLGIIYRGLVINDWRIWA